MANTIKLKRGSGSDPGASDLVVGEVAVRTDTGKLFTKKDDNSVTEIGVTAVADGSITSAKIADGAIVNADVNASAAIAGTKISPDFGSQNVTTTGNVGIGTGAGTSTPLHVVGSDNTTTLLVESTDADANVGPIIELFRNSGSPADNDALGRIDFRADDESGNVSTFARIAVTAIDVTNNTEDARIDFTAVSNDTFNPQVSITGTGLDVTGNITVSGTVDGRDVATDGTKLDGIESNATADQTAAEIKTLLNSNQLEAAQIANDAVTNGKIAADAVTTAKIADDAITAALIADGAIGAAAIGNDAVGSAELADDAVATSRIQDSAVSTAKIANNAVTADKLPNSEVTFAKITDIPQNRIVGRISSGSGVMQELTAANVRSIINVADGATNVTNTNQLTNGAGFITSADGGNAATLDSIDSSQFLRSDANDSASGLISLAQD